MTFELEQFVEDCRSRLIETDAQSAIAELIQHAISKPADLIAAFGEPRLAGLETIYHAQDLTILNIVWAPRMTLHPHNHCMWADIGIYVGQEENNFFQRTAEGLVQRGQTVLDAGSVAPLHEDVIHSVHNPSTTLTAAIHVYGGDFFAAPRSEWTPDTLEEQPFDIAHTRAVFDKANATLNLDSESC